MTGQQLHTVWPLATRQAAVWQVLLHARLLALWDLAGLLQADDATPQLTPTERRVLDAALPLWHMGKGERARGP